MSFRVGTPNYGLPQTEGTDKRDWSDTNQPFLLIDTAIKNAVDTSATASSAAATAQTTADSATTAAAHAQTDATTAQTLATSASELAQLAKSTADTAQGAANTAQGAANTAQVAANTAQGTADANTAKLAGVTKTFTLSSIVGTNEIHIRQYGGLLTLYGFAGISGAASGQFNTILTINNYDGVERQGIAFFGYESEIASSSPIRGCVIDSGGNLKVTVLPEDTGDFLFFRVAF